MPSNNIQWFPGHMAKTRRLITECLPLVDVVIEILDARIPLSSQNPEINKICGNKPRLVILSKATLADPAVNDKWRAYFSARGGCIVADFITGAGMKNIAPALRELLAEKIEKYESKGMAGKAIRAMVVGIPNVGKSSFINRFSGTKKAKVEDRPGVTVDKQWVKCPDGVELLDMPGVLWPKFEDETVGENLAMTGAIKDAVVNTDSLAIALCERLRDCAPELFCARYKIKSVDDIKDLDSYELFELVGRKRGFLISGGEIDYERTANILLDEFRGGKIGRISLEKPN
ncbi:MAG: ribosome biogenesis GTPase YlqF [Ruminococcaceae bacterium]|nr:ribosome biogenesis GTPase YlqF [Oscillospiraceae bacterium]